MSIERFPGSAQGRCRAVASNGLVFAVAVATDMSAPMARQTEQTLAALDKNLADAGSDKMKLLSATVYITDMSEKAEIDAVWNAWIGPEKNWPQRACVQAALAGGADVEITVVATA